MYLGRYEVVRELGKGAMGIVYLARDPVIGRLVALKTIRLTDSGDEEEVREFQQRFIREAQAAGVLSHPAIVTVHDIGQDDEKGVSFIAMEYVEGPTLKELIQQGKPLSSPEIASILAQVADALDFAHSRGIVHRDVKPANIILCGDRVKITDFGIAKIASEAANLTTTGQFLGTPNYMAPEQVKGAPVDGRTDVFSLGIVLYECLTRRKPFGGDSLTTISYRIVHEPFETPHEIDPSIPVVFDEVVNQCLAKDPKDRYQRARHVGAALRAIAAGEPLPVAIDDPGPDPTVIAAGRMQMPESPFSEARDRGASPKVPARKPGPLEQTLRRNMKRPVPAAMFFAVIVALLVSVGALAGWLWSQRVEVPVVDTRREELVARQRQLRTEGMRLLEQGNVEGAYQRFVELRRIAPRSREVENMVARLEQIRGEKATAQLRVEESRAMLEQGKQLYAAREYSKAIPMFEEAFNLDPSSTDAVNFVRMSREQLELRQLREAEQMAAKGVSGTTSGGSNAASVRIEFQGSLDKGYIMVQANSEKVLHEYLYSERGVFRRRAPRQVEATAELRPGPTEVIVWAVIPEMRITERKSFSVNLRPGSTHRILIRFDEAARRFQITMS
ncbi:MAG TPA: protein kinase [Thermoanaerobaculia bacterium]|nr:protein kinase [Thermoanaerobaculia bacterium]